MNGRIERMTPRDEFLIAMFQDDPQLLEQFREAERKRPTALFWVMYTAVATCVVTGFIYAVIVAYHWFQ